MVELLGDLSLPPCQLETLMRDGDWWGGGLPKILPLFFFFFLPKH